MPLTDTKCRNAKGQIKPRKLSAAEWMPDRRRMMQWWADHITALTLEGDKIIPLSRVG